MGFAALSVYALLLFGAETTCPGVDRGAAGCAALIFPDWPLFDGQLIPAFSADAAVANLQMRQFAHRIVAAIVGVIVLVTTIVVWRAARGRTARGAVPGADDDARPGRARPPRCSPSRSWSARSRSG